MNQEVFPPSWLKAKRPAGILVEDGEWLVVDESVKREDGSHIHKCGIDLLEKRFSLPKRKILGKQIALPMRYTERSGKIKNIVVLYCPKCEEEPIEEVIIRKIITGDLSIVFFPSFSDDSDE